MVYPGSIQLLYFYDLYGPSKDKLSLTVHVDPYWFFLISTEISSFKKERPALMQRQVVIDQASHASCLTHDSYLDCTDIHVIRIEELERQMKQEQHQVKGNASRAVLEKAIASLHNNPEISPKYQRRILSSLQPLVQA